MEIVSVGNNLSYLLERYPELLFLLSYTPFTEPNLEEMHSDLISEEIDLEGVDILYVYGVGLGHHYATLRGWLKEKRERRLVFLEDELSALSGLLHSEHAEELLHDPQVVVRFIAHLKSLPRELEELITSYSCDRVEVTATRSYQKRKKHRFHQIRLQVLRLSTVSHALLTEALYSHKLLVNLLRNIKRWPGSFLAGGFKGRFRGIPAVICGAGPSLQASLPHLKEMEDRALIIAGGSTIAALSNQGIQPHLGIALDPNPEEFGRLKIASSFEIPLIYATRLQPDVFNALNGERGYLISDTGGACERYFEKQMKIEGEPVGPELGQEALSVTTLAIALAVEMGCNPILLSGIDLAYAGTQRYAEGILPSSDIDMGEKRREKKSPERLLRRKNIHGHYVHTLVKWVMESECIAFYAKTHPETRFINVTEGGIGFPEIPNIPFSQAAAELNLSLDLRALIHAEIQRLKIPLSQEKIAHEMKEVGESLFHLRRIAEEMIGELKRIKDLQLSPPTGKMTILEIDFQEEKAFECLFLAVGPALDKLLARAFYPPSPCTEEEGRHLALECKIAKWQQWKEMIDSEIELFSTLPEEGSSSSSLPRSKIYSPI
ncbi:MAG: 6-hydroxymethylpterin diphosphokinase MptE-like protein [Rhabdochlamydiaceae bacterium]